MNTATTSTDIPTHSHTSAGDSVRMEVEPNSVLHTSPERLDEVEKNVHQKIPDSQCSHRDHGDGGVALDFRILSGAQEQSTALRMVMTITRGRYFCW